MIKSRPALMLLALALLASPCLRAQDAADPGGSGESGEAATGGRSFSSRFIFSGLGTVLVFPEDNGPRTGAPSPVLGALGPAVGFSVWGGLSIDFSLDIYFPQYNSWGYDYTLGRAIPVEWENRTAVVYGFVFALQFGNRFTLNKYFDARVYGGGAVDLRIVTLAPDLNDGVDDIGAIRDEADDVRKYFWTRGRMFYPVLGGGADYNISDSFKLGVDLRIWFPLYRVWTGETYPAVPFIEGWRFGLSARITWRGSL